MRLFLLVITLISSAILWAQKGTIKGTVMDLKQNVGVPFANVQLLKDTELVSGTTTDFDGLFELDVKPGVYSIEITNLGYKMKRIDSIRVDSNKTVFITKIGMTYDPIDYPGCTFRDYESSVFIPTWGIGLIKFRGPGIFDGGLKLPRWRKKDAEVHNCTHSIWNY